MYNRLQPSTSRSNTTLFFLCPRCKEDGVIEIEIALEDNVNIADKGIEFLVQPCDNCKEQYYLELVKE